MPQTTSRALGVALILGAAALWGATGTMQALLPQDRAPLAVGAIRLCLGAMTLLALALPVAASRAGIGQMLRKGRIGPVLGAGAAMTLYNLLFFAAVLKAGVGVGTAIAIGSAPIWVAGWESARGRPPKGMRLAGQAACIAGAAILALSGGAGGAPEPLLGAAMAAASGLAYAAYSGWTAKIAHHAPPMAVAATTFSAAAILALPALMLFPLGWAAAPAAWAPLAALGMGSTGLAYALYTTGLRSVAVSTAVTLALAEPLTAWVLAVLVVGEELTWMRAGGAGLLFLGLGLVSLIPSRR